VVDKVCYVVERVVLLTIMTTLRGRRCWVFACFSFFSISCVFSMDSSMYLGSIFTDFYTYIHDPILVVS